MKPLEFLGILVLGISFVVAFGKNKRTFASSLAGVLAVAFVIMGGYGVLAGTRNWIKPSTIKTLTAWVSVPENPVTLSWNPPSSIISTSEATYRSITWKELVKFIEDDHTNWNIYDPVKYNCLDFAVDLVANAHKQNIKAWIVAVEFYDQPVGHAFVGFETTDRGVVFVEPQGDNTYNDLRVGQWLCDSWGMYACMGKIQSVTYEQCDLTRYCTQYTP